VIQRRTLRPALLVVALLMLAGCNTVDGMGRDLSSSARTVSGWFGGGV
jgi:predicted small secreted protein